MKYVLRNMVNGSSASLASPFCASESVIRHLLLICLFVFVCAYVHVRGGGGGAVCLGDAQHTLMNIHMCMLSCT